SRLLEIASDKGSVKPHHYILPYRVRKNFWDPERPATYGLIKKIWAEARKRANVPNLRPHDPRHQVNTKLYENGADDMTVQEIMGWESRQMAKHYSSIRDERKWQAMTRALTPKNIPDHMRIRPQSIGGVAGMPVEPFGVRRKR